MSRASAPSDRPAATRLNVSYISAGAPWPGISRAIAGRIEPFSGEKH